MNLENFYSKLEIRVTSSKQLLNLHEDLPVLISGEDLKTQV